MVLDVPNSVGDVLPLAGNGRLLFVGHRSYRLHDPLIQPRLLLHEVAAEDDLQDAGRACEDHERGVVGYEGAEVAGLGAAVPASNLARTRQGTRHSQAICNRAVSRHWTLYRRSTVR